MHRYYKITRKWAERLNETETAMEHPDGMFLVLPTLGHRIAEVLQEENGGARLLPGEAFEAIGAIGLNVAEARASAKGELRHDRPSPESMDIDNLDKDNDNPENK